MTFTGDSAHTFAYRFQLVRYDRRIAFRQPRGTVAELMAYVREIRAGGRVKLVRKFANVLNGIDLTKVSVGDVINVAPHQAALLILEGWAEEAPHTLGTTLDLQSDGERVALSEAIHPPSS